MPASGSKYYKKDTKATYWCCIKYYQIVIPIFKTHLFIQTSFKLLKYRHLLKFDSVLSVVPAIVWYRANKLECWKKILGAMQFDQMTF